MSNFEKFARPYFRTETRLCFRVCLTRPDGSTTIYIVRYSYLIRFIRCFMNDNSGCYVTVLEKLHYPLPIQSFFVEVLPF